MPSIVDAKVLTGAFRAKRVKKREKESASISRDHRCKMKEKKKREKREKRRGSGGFRGGILRDRERGEENREEVAESFLYPGAHAGL